MYKNIFKQELIYWLKNPLTYFFGAVFFAFTFLMFAGSAGLFDPHVSGNKITEHLNSSFSLNFIMLYMNKLLFVLIPAIVGASIYKDFKYRVHSVLFSFPIEKVSYLLARISASFLIVIVITFSVLTAMIIGEFLPGLDPAKMGDFKPLSYVHNLIVYILPNLILGSAIVISIILFFRNIYAAFIGCLIPFLLQIISENAFVGHGEMIALLDPFGQNSLAFYTHDWSVINRNQNVLPLGSLVLANRIIWLTIATLLIYFSIDRFRLHENISFSWRLSLRRKTDQTQHISTTHISLDQLETSYATSNYWRRLWHLSMLNFRHIIKSPAFLGIAALAILAMIFAVNRVTQSGDIILMPVTKVILLVPATFYSIISIMLVFIYSGLIIHRETSARIEPLIDTTSTPFWVLWGSKLAAMIKVEMLLMAIFILTGIIIQIMQGHHNFELGLYMYHMFILSLLPLVLWTCAAFFIHTVINNYYLGLFVLLFGWVGIEGLPQIGLDSHLIRFNSLPRLTYSDMNGYASTDTSFLLVETYWVGFSIILMAIIHLLWPHGIKLSIWSRIGKMGKRLSVYIYSIVGVALILMCLTGMVIYKGESETLNLSGKSQNKHLSDFEVKFKKYQTIKSPKIQRLTARVELYPETQSFEATGSYVLKNTSERPIDTLLIRTGFDEITSFEVSVPNNTIDGDTFMKFYVVKLNSPILPQEEIELDFAIENKQNTLFERNSNVLSNGTFIKNDIFPRLGYTFSKASPHPEKEQVRGENYQAKDSDLVDVSLIIGTSNDQLAIAPGILKGEWEENDRKYFSYATEQPIKFSFGFNSGKYIQSLKDVAGVSLEIYSHHTSNLTTIQTGIEATLNYMKQHFSDYQHDQIRVIEFPDSEGTYATAFANNIPMSEIRFVSNTDEEHNKTDLAFYVPSHELIHHWFGTQLIPARAKGASMLTESITEYLTLKVYETHYGKKKADNFLKLQHRRYWNGHNKQTAPEPPLYLVEPHQQFISYGKGTVAMSAIGQMIGESKFNFLLFDFLNRWKNIRSYPTSVDFIEHLKNQLPDSVHSFIDNQFTSVAYFQNTIEDAAVRQLTSGNYEVTINLSCKKWSIDPADETKTPQSVQLDDWSQMGFYGANQELLETHWIQLTAEQMELKFILEERPTKIILDPNFIMLDKNKNEYVFEFE